MQIFKVVIVGSLLTARPTDNPKFNMQVNPREKACIVEALWYEVRGESNAGVRAVLTVIENRLQSREFSDSYCGVVYQNGQFTYPKAYRYKKPIARPTEQDRLEFIEQLAEQTLSGKFKITLPAKVFWFHNTDVDPEWSYQLRVANTIGNHKFYTKD